MGLIHGQVIVLDSIGTGRRGLYKPSNPTKRPDARCRLLGVEADHIDRRVEFLALHFSFEVFTVRPVTLNDAHAVRRHGRLSAVETHSLMSFFEQKTNDR